MPAAPDGSPNRFLLAWRDWIYRLKTQSTFRADFQASFTAQGQTVNIQLPFVAYSIELRNGTTDIGTFQSIFLQGICNISNYTNLRPRVVIDAGANIGLSSIFLTNAFPHARIIAIEPELSNLTLLKKNVSAYPNIDVRHAALWGSPRQLKIQNPHAAKNAFRTIPADSGEPCVLSVTIPQILDELADERIGLLKIDIEGAEKDVFSSDTEQWLGSVDALLIEIHDRFAPGAAYAIYRALVRSPFLKYLLGDNELFLFSSETDFH